MRSDLTGLVRDALEDGPAPAGVLVGRIKRDSGYTPRRVPSSIDVAHACRRMPDVTSVDERRGAKVWALTQEARSR